MKETGPLTGSNGSAQHRFNKVGFKSKSFQNVNDVFIEISSIFTIQTYQFLFHGFTDMRRKLITKLIPTTF